MGTPIIITETIGEADEKTFRFDSLSAERTDNIIYEVSGVKIFQNIGAGVMYISETPFSATNGGLLVQRLAFIVMSEPKTLHVRGEYSSGFFVKGKNF